MAVIVPAWQQPALLAEAVESVLASCGRRRVAAVVVDDGCPMEETRRTGLRLARAHPGKVHLLRRANGGLSAARNTGIDFALRAWPGCRSLFFLDADNRLGPRLIERAAELLEASGPETGWVYPDFDFFGVPESASAAGDYSRFMHLLENTSDAGSLVSRAVFEAGLRFDETMRDGFEDWDFWLRAAAAGFRGRHLPMGGFRYRRRAGGMRQEAERQRPAILAGMRRRLGPALRPRNLLRLEAGEVPRFLLLRAGSSGAELVVDPLRPALPALPREAARRRLVEASRHPQAVHAPPFLLFASGAALDALAAGRLLHNTLWQAEILLREAEVVSVTLAPSEGGRLSVERGEGTPGEQAALILFRSQPFAEAAALGSALASATRRGATLRVTLPLEAGTAIPPALPEAAAEFAALAEAFATRHPEHGEWRGDWRRPRSRAHQGYGELIGAGAVLPWLAPERGRDIALAVPVFEMGGVERVVTNLAAVLRERGWRPHLVVTGADTATLPPDALAAFETVQFPQRGGIEGNDPEAAHLGAPLPGATSLRDALGQLAPMEAVLATHSQGVHALAGVLRGLGVLTIAGLHVVERDSAGAPLGNPHALLAHEASYDAVAVVSEGLRDWCIAQGIPASKVLLVPNGPGHPALPGAAEAAMEGRIGREGPLRALFLGRLDPQKGLTRLRDIVALTPGVEWRAAGRAVLDRAPEPIPGLAVEPPAEGAALEALFAWADVLVLPSLFEGSPLTIPEAQRMGCVPLVTRTGAVAEMIADGVDGFLIPARPNGRDDLRVASDFASRLAALAADRPALLAAARAAHARAAALPGWAARMEPLLARLDKVSAP
ncbi:glycosyltransferase [Muricoccus pecuniae]|uniref:Glycosyltransferase involved in cell wall biosynthesis n=1 Tax=Muricoccus pecuniae TaxID=693023 RepID=A0A840YD25_9PROT|nr:glycosyltransferase [Roseomonas pecuniae]MBB5694021.1 glycosyltransferase involved in cell wall biosynthesis [Roseomonas pecuniae]